MTEKKVQEVDLESPQPDYKGMYEGLLQRVEALERHPGVEPNIQRSLTPEEILDKVRHPGQSYFGEDSYDIGARAGMTQRFHSDQVVEIIDPDWIASREGTTRTDVVLAVVIGFRYRREDGEAKYQLDLGDGRRTNMVEKYLREYSQPA